MHQLLIKLAIQLSHRLKICGLTLGSKESPYVKRCIIYKEIGVTIAAAISYCNKDVPENYLKELCKEMVIILKQQRGNILFLAHFY